MSKLFSVLRTHLRTVAIWIGIGLVIYALVSYNARESAKTTALLGSTQPGTLDETVLGLAQSDHLVDALANTSNPNEDATSPQNVKSVTIRNNAADSVNRLVASNKMSTDAAIRTLFELGKDGDGGVKGKASDGLATLGKANDANLKLVADHLKDGDPDVRGTAADALGKIGGDKTAKLVDSMLSEPTARESAESALTKIGAPAIPLLATHLQDPDLLYRQKIVSMFGDIGSPVAIPLLNQVATTETPAIRRVALGALNKIVQSTYDTVKKITEDRAAAKKAGKPLDPAEPKSPSASDMANVQSAEPVLIAALKDPSADSDARAQAALTLGRIGGAGAVVALATELGDYDSRIAQSAQVGMQLAGTPAVPSLLAILNNTQTESMTRGAAAQALGVIGDARGISAVDTLLANPATSVDIRRSAAIGLGQSSNPTVLPILMKALADPDGTVASAASQGLLNPDFQKPAVALLIASFKQQTPVPFNASQTLSQMGDLAVPELKTALANPNPQVQTWAAITLGQTDSKDPSVVAALTPLGQSNDIHVKLAASDALERLSRS